MVVSLQFAHLKLSHFDTNEYASLYMKSSIVLDSHDRL
jgi:hypothetical protein